MTSSALAQLALFVICPAAPSSGAPGPALGLNRVLAGVDAEGMPVSGHSIEACLAAAIREAVGDPLWLTDISLLFEPSLALDPLALLQRLAERRNLIVLWPGTWDGHTLTYAVPEHAHYRTWSDPRVRIITDGGLP